jgi:hypothetical protein
VACHETTPLLMTRLDLGGGPVSSAKLRDLGASRRHQLGVGVSVPVQTPSTLGRLGQENPRPVGQGRIRAGNGYEVGELAHDCQLLVPIQSACVGQHLDADVAGVGVDG